MRACREANSMPKPGMSRARGVVRDLLVLGAQAEVERQLADRPGVLEEEAEVVRVDIALGHEALRGVDAVRANGVVAVRACCRRQSPSPLQRHARARLAAQHVVANAVELHAELELVLAAKRRVRRGIGLEVGAGLLIANGLGVRRDARVPGRDLQVGRHSGKSNAARGGGAIQRLLGHVRVVDVRVVVTAARADEDTRAGVQSTLPESDQFGNSEILP